ncbi:platelet-derived growth factor D isoform X1 [Puntigrus tetrazona]|uniref:platelet-derived growth factor D isoform X1 n=1 Tax=Puntigrus tetrazona TaxID=1606681 RepID=UPI001C8980DA|nr:platelet-derived growth factor D isoform X1 [Puntigrus tetrazona]
MNLFSGSEDARRYGGSSGSMRRFWVTRQRAVRFQIMWLLVCSFIAALSGENYATQAQVMSSKALRASNARSNVTDSNRLTDLYRKEEVVMVKSGGHVQSPRFPSSYPRNLLLSWKLHSPPHTRILLEFDAQFGLEEAENGVCRYDYVEVEDISETSTIIWGRWCGQRAPTRITSKTNLIKITFKSDDYFVAKPGFKICYSLLDSSALASLTNWEAVTAMSDFREVSGTDTPLSAVALDNDIASISTVEELLRHMNPFTWQEDLEQLYTHTHYYRPRAFHTDRKYKIDLDRLYDDVKQYSCTPRNFSVNLREELRATNAVFFPRCLLVQRCGGNCACGTDNWNSCSCSAGKTVMKLHEVLKFSPGPSFHRKRTRAHWVLEEIYLQHHERCDCVCLSRPPR